MKTRNTLSMYGMLCVMLLALALPVSAEEAVIHFDHFEVGQTPRGFSTALTGGGGPVSWIIQEDATAPSGGKVLAQTSTDRTD